MIRGIVTIFLLSLNAAFWGSCIVLLGLVKFAVQITAPRSRTRTRVILMLAWLGTRWAAGNDRIFDLMLPTRWEISGIGDEVRPDGRYLIISNHVSWVDIFALFRAFRGRTAFIRFFLKRQLFWAPLVGQACWALEFPFMHRYTPEYLEKHPEKRGTDLATTRKACQRYRNFPVAILNFLEGTRFTKDKHDDQQSPYRHLLRPRILRDQCIAKSLLDIEQSSLSKQLAQLAFVFSDIICQSSRFLCRSLPVCFRTAPSLLLHIARPFRQASQLHCAPRDRTIE